MTRLQGKDNLDDIRGKCGLHFRASALAFLNTVVINGSDQIKTADLLRQFYRAAGRLCSSESDFNRRARPKNGPHVSLMTHLREPEQLRSLRDFNDSKTALLGASPVAPQIIRLVERSIDASVRTRARLFLPVLKN